MYRLLVMVFAIGGFIFSGSLDETIQIDQNSSLEKNQYSWANDSSDDYKLEAGRRRGKHNRGDRRRGGSGLR